MDWNPPDAWDKMADFLKNLHTSLPRQPQAILMVSAHWLEPHVGVTSAAQPDLIYDYHGFPPHTYALKYPAPGHPALAEQIVASLNAAGIPSATYDQRGFDHGMFIPMMLMFPKADIPVVQLSLHNSLDPQAHLKIGHALQALRAQDV
jgi:aromatic ring-opening dioxygenase catalytic subunit (LigB family)